MSSKSSRSSSTNGSKMMSLTGAINSLTRVRLPPVRSPSPRPTSPVHIQLGPPTSRSPPAPVYLNINTSPQATPLQLKQRDDLVYAKTASTSANLQRPQSPPRLETYSSPPRPTPPRLVTRDAPIHIAAAPQVTRTTRFVESVSSSTASPRPALGVPSIVVTQAETPSAETSRFVTPLPSPYSAPPFTAKSRDTQPSQYSVESSPQSSPRRKPASIKQVNPTLIKVPSPEPTKPVHLPRARYIRLRTPSPPPKPPRQPVYIRIPSPPVVPPPVVVIRLPRPPPPPPPPPPRRTVRIRLPAENPVRRQMEPIQSTALLRARLASETSF